MKLSKNPTARTAQAREIKRRRETIARESDTRVHIEIAVYSKPVGMNIPVDPLSPTCRGLSAENGKAGRGEIAQAKREILW